MTWPDVASLLLLLLIVFTLSPGEVIAACWRPRRCACPLTSIFNTFNLLLPSCLRNTTPTSARRVLSFLADRSSASPSPGRSYATPRSCSWTRPPPPWTPRARRYASLNSELHRRIHKPYMTVQCSCLIFSGHGEQREQAVNYYYH